MSIETLKLVLSGLLLLHYSFSRAQKYSEDDTRRDGISRPIRAVLPLLCVLRRACATVDFLRSYEVHAVHAYLLSKA